ncbi:unnamed protein product [Protopolystoma xenopodis]|uniref:Uncharacterized protein n=1 Tax=Protopolystoma xenopodis TaxID=117903 RepID=A0A448XRG9_9PLAT|nr:unnamed protein product [Protopolystoma xenopodis]
MQEVLCTKIPGSPLSVVGFDQQLCRLVDEMRSADQLDATGQLVTRLAEWQRQLTRLQACAVSATGLRGKKGDAVTAITNRLFQRLDTINPSADDKCGPSSLFQPELAKVKRVSLLYLTSFGFVKLLENFRVWQFHIISSFV